MNYLPSFRLTTLAMALLLGWYSIATLFAEISTPKVRTYSFDLGPQNQELDVSPFSDWASQAAPFRADLLANMAFAHSGPVIGLFNAQTSQQKVARRERALSLARHSLSDAPHAADVWLLLAALQRNQASGKSATAEALKMSYLTAPGNASLFPARLLILSDPGMISDPDLRDLGRGDIRIILTRRPDLKPAITRAYQSAGAETKKYLQEVVKSFDEGFAASLL
ncbi:hypothetical protein [Bradyrhizobium sp. BR13661]|jgi:hypothetical protein|uniref:hypothetical protein n=1 Tax=Bradyrhizobium sp. BR13661 TaxID=2940622 RepID=UPI0024732E97|nr:hypothetical protein [Bradyrhizobium sp. BR13661]MDH6263548.1 hypothetical protein [Bradyrhizobium sp. BR13661]